MKYFKVRPKWYKMWNPCEWRRCKTVEKIYNWQMEYMFQLADRILVSKKTQEEKDERHQN